jgi:type II restriction/modification system DNA methylase subunit YeeA
MLGRIFENLLAEINPETGETARKATGSYYTPREIVDYMVGQSLKYYLLEKTKISEEKIDQLIQNTFDTIELSNASKEEIIDALSSLTVIDPACGSGAFPMGILQKTVSILNEIDPDSKLWLDKQLKKINDNLLKDTMRKKLDKETINYIFKLGLIKNSIYGVDIQEIAVELSKLRVFLSLIVDAYVDDSKENRGLEPLPNLEFKFVCANSLIDLPEEKHYLVDAKTGYSNKLIEELKKLREDYFRSYGSEKERIKKEFKEKQKQLLDIFMEWGKNMEDKKSFMLSEWDPFSDKPSSWFNPEWMFGLKDGFDIVIANPPYVRQERIKEQKSYLESQGYEVFNGTADLYTYFYEKGYNLLKNNGILVFISSNKWMRAKYGECLRKFIKERTKISEVIDFGGQKVFDATVDTNILIFKALKQQNSNLKKDNKSQEMIYKENTFNGISVKEDFNIGTGIYDYVRNNSIQLKQDEIDSRTFLIADGGTLSLKAKIEKIGKPLKDWGVRICFGIKTGFNEAFIIDTATRNEILSNCKTEEERKRTEEIIKPILRGRDIGRYYYKWADLWIIKIESGWTNKKIIDAPPLSFPNASIGNPEDKTKALALKMFQETYPAIYNYLISFANVKGKSKGKGLFNRDDQGDYWWELRDCDYYPEFEKEKIVWAEMTDEPAFVLDNLKFYTNQTAYIMTGKNLKYVIGILNSKISHFYLTKIAYSLSQNANRWIKQYVEQLPLPLITPQNQSIADQIVQLVDQILSLTQSEDYLQNLQKQAKVKELERKIDKLVYKLYDLTNEEVTIVEKGFVNESDK